MIAKKISPSAIVALKEALSNIYWFKKDLRAFLSQSIGNQPFFQNIDWNAYKRNIVDQLIGAFNQENSKHGDVLLRLIRDVSDISDFSHLQNLEDGDKKVKAAAQSLTSLRKLTKGYFEKVDEEEKIAERKLRAELDRKRNAGLSEALEKLKVKYFELITSKDPQQRGYKLEKLIAELFDAFDLDPKASFKIVGEQIDGAFTFDSTDFLFEGKWTADPIQAKDLDSLAAKISRRLDNTLGLLLAINGFSNESVLAHSSGRKVLILADGADLMAVLDGRIDLKDLLYRKRRHASQTGSIFLSVTEILTSDSSD